MSVAVALMMKSEVLPVIVLDGDNSSPSVPAGTGGPKSKSKQVSCQNLSSLVLFYFIISDCELLLSC